MDGLARCLRHVRLRPVATSRYEAMNLLVPHRTATEKSHPFGHKRKITVIATAAVRFLVDTGIPGGIPGVEVYIISTVGHDPGGIPAFLPHDPSAQYLRLLVSTSY